MLLNPHGLFKGGGKLATSAWDRYGDSITSAWGRYGDSIAAGVNSADRWTGSAVNWLRNVHQVQESFAGGAMTMGGGSKWRLNAWDDSADPFSQQFMAMATGGSKKSPIILGMGGKMFDKPIGVTTPPPIPDGLLKTDIIGMSTKAGYERHHLISAHIAPDFEVMLIAARKYGYSINNRNNGMYLPDNVTESIAKKLPLHKGNHSGTYYDEVRRELQILQDKFNDGLIKEEKLTKAIKVIENRLHDKLKLGKLYLSTDGYQKHT
jgi:hypothetical protein